MNESKSGRNRTVRRNVVSVAFSDREMEAVEEFCQMFKAQSKSAAIRESAVRYIMEKLIDRKSSLFPDYDAETLFAGEPCEDDTTARIDAFVARDNRQGQASLFSAEELKEFTINRDE